MGLHFNWWQTLLILLGILISTIACLPCSILQKCGLKMKLYSRILHKLNLDQLSYFDVKIYKKG